LRFGVWGAGRGIWGGGVGVWVLKFGVWGLGFGVWGLGFGVWGLGFGFWGCQTTWVRPGRLSENALERKVGEVKETRGCRVLGARFSEEV